MKKSSKQFYCPYANECFECCLDTEMILLNSEIDKIVSLGYNRRDFIENIEGFLQLKNIKGKCFFLKEKKCSIYENRPQGCRYYPLIYDLETGEYIIDNLCTHNKSFFVEDYQHLQNKVLNLVNQLLKEKENREKK